MPPSAGLVLSMLICGARGLEQMILEDSDKKVILLTFMYLFFNLFFIYFIFGCIGFSLLHAGFL